MYAKFFLNVKLLLNAKVKEFELSVITILEKSNQKTCLQARHGRAKEKQGKINLY
jgi:hypothetical protein